MITILKYSNRKLYVPKGQGIEAGYIVIDEIANLIRQGKQVQVLSKGRDKLGVPSNDSGQDITKQVLREVLTRLVIPDNIIVELVNKYRNEE